MDPDVPLEIVAQPDGRAVALVPTEAVLLLAVALPGTAGQRRAALPFAVEERVAEPVEALHVVLGAATAPGTWLAGAVARTQMERWLAALDAAGHGPAHLLPDALRLPVPPAGMWHVAALGARVVVRLDDGTGFACRDALFPALWADAGSPPLTPFGDAAPPGLPPPARCEALPPLDALALDLRSGAYAPPAPPLTRAVRRAAAVAAAGLVAHTLLLAADARVLAVRAAAHRERAEALLRQALPGTPLPDDDRLLPAAGGRDPLLPLLVRTAAALQPAGGIGWSRLAWNAADARLTLGLRADDIAGLQRAVAALAAAGLAPVSGATTAGTGRADGDVTVRGRA